MSSFLAPLLWLQAGATLALGGLAAAAIARPEDRRVGRALAVAAALLAAAALPLASAGGWWIDLPARKLLPILTVLALGMAAMGFERLAGRLAALAVAAFFGTLGVMSLRNGGPLGDPAAGAALLFGLLLGLLPWRRVVRLRMLALLGLLAAGAVPAVLQALSPG